jgi:hypothetical protein
MVTKQIWYPSFMEKVVLEIHSAVNPTTKKVWWYAIVDGVLYVVRLGGTVPKKRTETWQCFVVARQEQNVFVVELHSLYESQTQTRKRHRQEAAIAPQAKAA